MEISPFLATSFAGGGAGGGVGGRREEPKADQKIVIRSRVLCNNYLEAFSTQSQVLLASIVEGKEIYFFTDQEPIIGAVFLKVSYSVVFSMLINKST